MAGVKLDNLDACLRLHDPQEARASDYPAVVISPLLTTTRHCCSAIWCTRHSPAASSWWVLWGRRRHWRLAVEPPWAAGVYTTGGVAQLNQSLPGRRGDLGYFFFLCAVGNRS